MSCFNGNQINSDNSRTSTKLTSFAAGGFRSAKKHELTPSHWQVVPGRTSQKTDAVRGEYREAWKSVRFVATWVAETIQRFPITRFRHRVDPFRVDITLKSDAAMQLVARSRPVPGDRQAPHLIGRLPELLCWKWQTHKPGPGSQRLPTRQTRYAVSAKLCC